MHHLLTKAPCRLSLVHFVNSSVSGYVQLGISPDVWNGCCCKNVFYKLVSYCFVSSDSGRGGVELECFHCTSCDKWSIWCPYMFRSFRCFRYYFTSGISNFEYVSHKTLMVCFNFVLFSKPNQITPKPEPCSLQESVLQVFSCVIIHIFRSINCWLH